MVSDTDVILMDLFYGHNTSEIIHDTINKMTLRLQGKCVLNSFKIVGVDRSRADRSG